MRLVAYQLESLPEGTSMKHWADHKDNPSRRAELRSSANKKQLHISLKLNWLKLVQRRPELLSARSVFYLTRWPAVPQRVASLNLGL